MQEIQFTKLKELPTPKSVNEKLLVSIDQDHLQAILVNIGPSGELFFNIEINPNWLYAHIKITESSIDKDKRIKELEYYQSISDSYVKALEGKLNAIELLKAAEINLNKACDDYYPY